MATTRQHNRQPVITASEIGEFVYCAKAWQLKRAGEEADSPALAQGTAFHAKHVTSRNQNDCGPCPSGGFFIV